MNGCLCARTQIDSLDGHSELATHVLAGTAGTPTLQLVRFPASFGEHASTNEQVLMAVCGRLADGWLTWYF